MTMLGKANLFDLTGHPLRSAVLDNIDCGIVLRESAGENAARAEQQLLGDKKGSQFADGIGYILDFCAAKPQDEPVPGSLADIGSRKRHQPKVLARRPLSNFAITNPFQRDRKMHAGLSASNVCRKTQFFADAIVQYSSTFAIEQPHPSNVA